jgi:glycosyltransferase involved in cell wall biosynthesis
MTRVLMVADGGWPTGFERVARGIGSWLQANGFEVTHRGLGLSSIEANRVAPYPYDIKPTAQSSEDPLAVSQVPLWLKEDKPDVVLFIQDLWNQTNYMGYVPRDVPTVGYYPVDTPNIKWSYAMGAAALTEAVPYTSFGAQETAIGVRDLVDMVLTSYDGKGVSMESEAAWMTLPKDGMELHLQVDRVAARQNVEGYRPIPHGYNPGMFFPLDKAECRKIWNFPRDAFIVLNVNTNQFRKRQDVTIRAFAKMAEHVPNALLVLHCAGKDKEGWDLAQLARFYGVQDKVICTHWAYPELTDEQLCMLYNTADVQINTGGGEGWGLSAQDGALCGVPQIVPDWSATREIWKDSGVLLPVSEFRFEPKYINTAHAIIDVRQAATLLKELAADRDRCAEVGAACRARAEAGLTWDQVGQLFGERISGAIAAAGQPSPTLRLSELRSRRTGTIVSELYKFDR